MKNKLKIAILGDGGWGTTLAILLSKKGFDVTVWGAFPKYVKYLSSARINKKFLPGIKIPREIVFTDKLQKAVVGKNIVVLALPSQYMRSVVRKIPRPTHHPIFVSASKGIENRTLFRMSEVIRIELGRVNLAALSGPTISYEVARSIPTSTVVASTNERTARKIQDVFSAENFRIYTTTDLIGAELGGSLKNIIAISAGIADGLGLGTNSKAALLARGLAEITRLGMAMGAKKETFYGLSGLGDLVTTCISPHGRNRWFGEQVGKGKSPKQVLHDTEMVIEGVPTTTSAFALAKKYRIEMPITEQIYNILHKHKSPNLAVKELMLRPKKAESI